MLIKNAILPSGELIDIRTTDGLIEEISKHLPPQSHEIIDLKAKYYISAGWIDIHTHAFPKYPPYFAEADEIGVYQGVTTLVDAGSSGANDIDEFFEYSKTCKTDVFSFLNISKLGLSSLSELKKLQDIDGERIKEALEKHDKFIIGLKARISASVVGNNSILALKKALEFKEDFKLPLMVHIGSAPPKIDELLELMGQNCIITHSFNGKSNNLFSSSESIEKLKKAIDRGLKLDLGHGSASFDFTIAQKASNLGINIDSISSDIYTVNKEKGPVYSLANVMSKFLILGYALEEIIKKVTENPAKLLNLSDRGVLVPGKKADFTIFDIEEGEFPFIDSSGTVKNSTLAIKVKYVIKDGKLIKGD